MGLAPTRTIICFLVGLEYKCCTSYDVHWNLFQIVDQKWVEKKKVKVPFVQHPYKVKGKFQFMAPTEIEVVGSYALGTCIKPNIAVDIAVKIPPVSMIYLCYVL